MSRPSGRVSQSTISGLWTLWVLFSGRILRAHWGQGAAESALSAQSYFSSAPQPNHRYPITTPSWLTISLRSRSSSVSGWTSFAVAIPRASKKGSTLVASPAKQRHIARAASEVQHFHAGPDAGVTKQAFGARRLAQDLSCRIPPENLAYPTDGRVRTVTTFIACRP